MNSVDLEQVKERFHQGLTTPDDQKVALEYMGRLAKQSVPEYLRSYVKVGYEVRLNLTPTNLRGGLTVEQVNLQAVSFLEKTGFLVGADVIAPYDWEGQRRVQPLVKVWDTLASFFYPNSHYPFKQREIEEGRGLKFVRLPYPNERITRVRVEELGKVYAPYISSKKLAEFTTFALQYGFIHPSKEEVNRNRDNPDWFRQQFIISEKAAYRERQFARFTCRPYPIQLYQGLSPRIAVEVMPTDASEVAKGTIIITHPDLPLSAEASIAAWQDQGQSAGYNFPLVNLINIHTVN